MEVQCAGSGNSNVVGVPQEYSLGGSRIMQPMYGRVDNRSAYNISHHVCIEEFQFGEYLINDSQLAILTVIAKNGKCQKTFSNGYIQECTLIHYSEDFNHPDEYLVTIKVLNKKQSATIRFPAKGVKPNDFVNLFRSHGGMSFFGNRSNREIYELLSNLLASMVSSEKTVYVEYNTGWRERRYAFPNVCQGYQRSPLTDRKLNLGKDSNVSSALKYLNANKSCILNVNVLWLMILWLHTSVLTSLFQEQGWYVGKTLCFNGNYEVLTNIAKYFLAIFESNVNSIIPISSSFDKIIQSIHDAKDEILIVDMSQRYGAKETHIAKNMNELIAIFSHRSAATTKSKDAQDRKEVCSRSLLLLLCENNSIPVNTQEVVQVVISEEEFGMNKYLDIKYDTPYLTATHLFHFIKWVEKNYDHVAQMITGNTTQYLKKFSQVIMPENRQLLAVLLTTYQIFSKYCQDINIPSECLLSIGNMEDIMKNLISKHEVLSSGGIEEVLEEVIISRMINNEVTVMQKTSHTDGTELSQSTILFDEDYIYIKRELIDKLVKESFGDNYSLNDMLGSLTEKNVLTKYDQAHNSYRYRLTLNSCNRNARFNYLRFRRNFIKNIEEYEAI